MKGQIRKLKGKPSPNGSGIDYTVERLEIKGAIDTLLFPYLKSIDPKVYSNCAGKGRE